ncbi:MAG: hypothetical protein H6700_04545 [Myxococcales bacterium]|nr:hypothetical protein [Myxococcales bacterium]MCB9531014.1 hypothetical protein [Myxococcales bacterium]
MAALKSPAASEARLVCAQGLQLDRDAAGVWRLFENTAAWLEIAAAEPDAVAAWNGIEIERDVSSRGSARWRLPHGLWAGDASIRVYDAGSVLEIPVHVRADPAKLEHAAWTAMLRELETWISALTVGGAVAGHGGVSQQGAAAPLIAEALVPLVPEIVSAIEGVHASPRRLEATRLEEALMSRAPRIDAETTVWLSRHPKVIPWTKPWLIDAAEGAEPAVPVRRSVDLFDHPANRWLRWATGRAARLLWSVASLLRRSDEKTSTWAAERADRCAAAAEALAGVVRRTFLRDLSPAPSSDAALLVMTDDPRYARLAGLLRPFMAPRFSIDAARPVGLKPTYELYELWCFLSVYRAIRRSLGAQTAHGAAEWSWTSKGLQNLLGLTGTGAGAQFAARRGNESLNIEFNPTFQGYTERVKHESRRWSLSGQRRPDIVVTWSNGQDAGWLALDAKYRVSHRALADAFTSVHVYRDALRDEDFGGAPLGVWLLSPAVATGSEAWFEPSYWSEHRCGAVMLTPGRPAPGFIAGLVECDPSAKPGVTSWSLARSSLGHPSQRGDDGRTEDRGRGDGATLSGTGGGEWASEGRVGSTGWLGRAVAAPVVGQSVAEA